MSKNAALLSIVVPDYNEEHTIGDVIDRLKATLQKTGFAYEIIVLDDCSRDRSAEISLSKHATGYSLKQHMGKGFANAAGVRIFNLMFRILTGAAVSDSQSGYRAMKSEVLANLRLRSGTYEIESETLGKTD